MILYGFKWKKIFYLSLDETKNQIEYTPDIDNPYIYSNESKKEALNFLRHLNLKNVRLYKFTKDELQRMVILRLKGLI